MRGASQIQNLNAYCGCLKEWMPVSRVWLLRTCQATSDGFRRSTGMQESTRKQAVSLLAFAIGAHQILALFHGWAMLSATLPLDAARAVIVDEAISALLGSSPA